MKATVSLFIRSVARQHNNSVVLITTIWSKIPEAVHIYRQLQGPTFRQTPSGLRYVCMPIEQRSRESRLVAKHLQYGNSRLTGEPYVHNLALAMESNLEDYEDMFFYYF